MKRIVVVCSGNICRSPMAAALVEKGLADAKISGVVISGGTLNIQGQPASPNAVEAMRMIGIDIAAHRSQGASAHLLRLSDNILIMSPGHEQHLLRMDPGLERKIHRLWEYSEPRGRLDEIADPVGLDLKAFVACREELERCVAAWMRRLIALT